MPQATLSSVLSCLSDYDPHALPVARARQIIEQVVCPIQSVEQVALRSSLGRVLARDIFSPIDVPAHDNSAMDGFALRAHELTNQPGPEQAEPHVEAGREFVICGTALAGQPFQGQVLPGQCVRIMTGAVMPAECDAVVPQEFTQAVNEHAVRIPAQCVNAGDNRRLKGEDLTLGQVALHKGTIVRPADLGLLASLGQAEVAVMRRLRVAFFSTGDELRSVGETLDAGCVYDSNRYTIYGMLQRLGCDVIDMGVVKDDPVTLEAAFKSACENADAIITSGGVSVGAADYTKQIMGKLGEVAFWTIGMRPGRPMAFGHIQSNDKQACLFGLPGNPVAVMVTFYFFVRTALYGMMGAQVPPLPLIKARSQQALRKKPGRTEYQRGILSHDNQGRPQVQVTGAQGSGILRSMSEANCMIVLAHEQSHIASGDEVDVILFEGLI
jgi:molybdopterin molybdotransferase